MKKADVSWHFIGLMLFSLLMLIVLLWAVGIIGDRSFSLLDRFLEWFSWR